MPPSPKLTAPYPKAIRPAPLTLVVHGIARAWSCMDPVQRPQLPALQKLVRRGVVAPLGKTQTGWLPLHLHILELLQLPADRMHASAPLEWLGQGGAPQPGTWLQAAFVHFELGSNSARLQRIENLDPEEAAALLETLQANLRFPGVEVLASPDTLQSMKFFLHSEVSIEADCFPADFGADVNLRDVLPQGREGPRLRRLLTEAQMLLHDHPVNVVRASRGRLLVNAIWLTGIGEFAGLRSAALPRITGNDTYLKGLCRLYASELHSIPSTAASALSGDAPGLIELSLRAPTEPASNLLALERVWFAPLIAAIEAQQLTAARLLLDQHLVWIDRSGLRRFWRNGPALARLLA